jgi:4-hydroxy-3-polyprenylbenzoate decarboxylase
MKLVIAATGASGTIYLQRLLDQIDATANEVHLVMSAHAKQVAAQEVEHLAVPQGVVQHAENDLNVPFVSGSARFDAMVIVPCSMATLGRIASGVSDSALLRAADVFLKERRKLIVVPRETPWSLIHARNVVFCSKPARSCSGDPLLLQPAAECERRRRYCRLADSRSNRSAKSARLSLERRRRPTFRLENRRLARAMAGRIRTLVAANLGAHFALPDRRPRECHQLPTSRALHRGPLA